jgi:hypothetical protein
LKAISMVNKTSFAKIGVLVCSKEVFMIFTTVQKVGAKNSPKRFE